MSIFNKISGFLIHKKSIEPDSELAQRILLLNFSIIAAALLNLIFSVIHFISFDRSFSIILFSFFTAFILLFYLIKNIKNCLIKSYISSILISILFIIIIFIGAGNKTGIIWGLIYPIFISFTFERKKTIIFSLLFLIITLLIFYIPNDIKIWAEYSSDLKLRYLAAYILILIFIQFFFNLKQQVISIKEKKYIEIQQELSEKNKFLSNLSYQIRTPLNNITGIINLQRDSLNEEVVEEVELSISNLIAIINSIPETFEKKLIPVKGKKANFCINTVIKKSLKLFQTEKYDKLKCSLNLSNKIPPQVFGDRLLLIQIIVSVIDFLYNNLSSDNLKLNIISKEENKNIILKICCPLTDSSFNEKFKISPSEFETGSIPEISVIRNMTKSASGELKLKIAENELSFLFTFNYLEEKERKEINDKKEVTVEEDFFKSQKKIQLKDANILLVEDDIMNNKVMTLNLYKHVNKIITAENGKEALAKYASTKIDLILMDIRMPLMDGFKTTEKIREAEQGTDSQTPIIAVTANVSAEIKKKCFKVGMNDYTTKPTNFKLLLKKMEALLN